MNEKEMSTQQEEIYECSNCGTRVSAEDTVCPKCGETLEGVLENDSHAKKRPVIIGIVAIFGMLGSIFFICLGVITIKQEGVLLGFGMIASGLYLFYCARSLDKMKKWAAIFYLFLIFAAFISTILSDIGIIPLRIEPNPLGILVGIFLTYAIIRNWRKFD